MPTTDQLQDQINTLQARLANLDGIGLSDPNLSQVTVLSKRVAGVEQSVKQVTLKLESLLVSYKTQLDGFISLLKQHLGIS